MTDLETALREGLHRRLDDVDVGPGTLAAVPARAARIRRGRTAAVASAASLTLLAGVSAAAYLPRGDGDDRSFHVTDDGDDAPDRPERADLRGRAEHYAELLAAGDYAAVRADMTAPARRALTEDRLRLAWRGMFGDEVANHVSAGRESRTGDRRVASALVQGPTSPGGTLYVVFDDEFRVSGLLLLEPSGLAETWEPAVARAHEVVTRLDRGEFAQVRRDFDATMLAGLSAARLGAVWQQVVDLYGPVQGRSGHLVTLTSTGHRVVDVVVHFRDGVMKVRVAFDARQRIAGLYVLVLDA